MLFRRFGQSLHVPLVLHNLGQVARFVATRAGAQPVLPKGLALLRDLGDRRGEGLSLAGLAAIAALRGQPERAARLFGASDALLAAAGVAMEGPDLAVCEQQRAATRSSSGTAVFMAAWDAGAALPHQQAIAEGLAFAAEDRLTAPVNPPPGDALGLSPVNTRSCGCSSKDFPTRRLPGTLH